MHRYVPSGCIFGILEIERIDAGLLINKKILYISEDPKIDSFYNCLLDSLGGEKPLATTVKTIAYSVCRYRVTPINEPSLTADPVEEQHAFPEVAIFRVIKLNCSYVCQFFAYKLYRSIERTILSLFMN